MLLPLWSLQDRIGESWVPLVALGFAAVLAAAFLFVPGRYALVLPLLVLGLWILAVKPIWFGKHGFERFSRGALFQGIRTVDRDWIDQKLPSGARAAFLWTGRTDRFTVNQNEFFNRAVGPVYYVTDPTPGGLPTPASGSTQDRAVTLGDEPRVTGPPADSSFAPDGTPIATDKGWGVTPWRACATARVRGAHRGALSERHRSGPTVTYTRRRAPGASPSAVQRREPVHLPAAGGRALERTRRGRAGWSPEGRHPESPFGPRRTTDCRVVYTVTPTAIPAEVTAGGNPDPREPAPTSSLHLQAAARIAFDVSPLSHPLLGIGNHMRALGGLAEGPRPARITRSPRRAKGPSRTRAALAVDVEVRTAAALSHAVRTAWSALGHPAAERLLGEFDAPPFSDWMYPPQRSGVRATTIHDLVPLHHPEWTTARTKSMHARKYRNAASTCDVVFVNSAYTGRDVTATLGVPSERIRVAHPAAKDVFHADGPAADLGAPYVLTVATLEPRKNLHVLVEAHRILGGELQLAVVGAEGWGEQPLLDAPGIRRLGYVSDDELARLYRGAAVVAYPSRFEGFGIPVIEAMACVVPVVSSSHESLAARAECCVRADWRIQLPSRQGSTGMRTVTAWSRPPEHVRSFSWRAVGETFLRAYEEASQ
jgi:glycosyltransferase involved in cell wall biosynthesis